MRETLGSSSLSLLLEHHLRTASWLTIQISIAKIPEWNFTTLFLSLRPTLLKWYASLEIRMKNLIFHISLVEKFKNIAWRVSF